MKGPAPVPNLEDLIQNPAAVNDLPAELVPSLRGMLAELDTLLLSRWLSANHPAERQPRPDRILNFKEAAAKFNRSVDWLYRNKRKLPFFVDKDGIFGFSELLMDEYIRKHAGR